MKKQIIGKALPGKTANSKHIHPVKINKAACAPGKKK